MKQQFFLLGSMLSLALLTIVGCTKQNSSDYINLSQQAGTLAATVDTPLTITIEASQSWTATSSDTWLIPEKVDENTLSITANDNTDANEREGIISVTAGQALVYIIINQLGYDSPIHFRELSCFQYDAAVSPDGTYVGGFIYSVDEMSNGFFQPVIIETATDTWHYLDTYPQSKYDLTRTSVITNDGLLFIENNNGGGQIIFSLTEEPLIPDASSAGFSTLPVIQGTASDGTTWVGYCMKDGFYCPVIWRAGVAEELPWPEKNFRDEPFLNGIIARGISADGTVAYGSTWDNYDFGMVYWKDGEVHYVGEDVREVTEITVDTVTGPVQTHMASGMTCTSEMYKVCPNGEWIAGTYRSEIQPGEGEAPVTSDYKAAFYNTVEKKTYFADGFATAIGVTNEGIGFVSASNLAISTCNVYDIKNGTDLGSINDWVLREYGYILPQGYAQYASEDKKTLFGSFMVMDDGLTTTHSWYLHNTEN